MNEAIIAALREDCRQAGGSGTLWSYIPIKGFKPFPALRKHMQGSGAEYIDLTAQRPVPPT